VKLISLILLSFCVFSCSSSHPDNYIYQDQVYTTKVVDSFEFGHYRAYANSNTIVINDNESLKDTERMEYIDLLCKTFSLNCNKVNISEVNKETASKMVQLYSKFKGEKIFLVAPNNDLAAQFVSTIDYLQNKGDQNSIAKIYTQLKVENSEEAQARILSLKK